jgi:hypothetical protein
LLFIKCYYVYKIKDEMGGPCSMYGIDDRCLYFSPNHVREKPLGRHRYTWEDNIKMDLKKDGTIWTAFIWLRTGTSADGNEL